MTDNIVSFPKEKIVRVPSAEILEKLRSQGTKNFADGFSEEVVGLLLAEFNDGGLDCEDDYFAKDFTFLADAVKALIYRSLSLEHPLHEVIDKEGTDDTL